MPEGHARDSDLRFIDRTYDGRKEQGQLQGEMLSRHVVSSSAAFVGDKIYRIYLQRWDRFLVTFTGMVI